MGFLLVGFVLTLNKEQVPLLLMRYCCSELTESRGRMKNKWNRQIGNGFKDEAGLGFLPLLFTTASV